MMEDAARELLGQDVRSVSLPATWYTRRSEGDAVLAGATGIPLPFVEHSHAGSACGGLAVLLHPEGREAANGDDVNDELVAEFRLGVRRGATGRSSETQSDKNIRRRVYDALNVLMAMDIIQKEKKEIRWKGLPANHVQEYQ